MNEDFNSSAVPLDPVSKGTTFAGSRSHGVLAWVMNWESLFVVVTLTFSTGAFVTLLPGEMGLEEAARGEMVAQIIWSVLYFITLMLIWKRRQEFLSLLIRDKFLLALIGWAAISVFWSISPSVTGRHSVALIGTVFFGTYLSLRFELRQRLKLVFLALIITVTASLVACIFFPDFGIFVDPFTGDKSWQGVFSHKNELASVLVSSVMTLAVLKRGLIKITYMPFLILSFLMLLATKALTSVIYFPLVILAVSLARRYQFNRRVRRKLILALCFVMSLGAYILYQNWEDITESLGKDPNLTGRVVLWVLSIPPIIERPIQGYGLDGFWYESDGPAQDIRSASGWLEAPNAHNGIINLWLDLGAVGATLFLASFLMALIGSIQLVKHGRKPETVWYLVFLIFLFAYSLTETSFMIRNDFSWILYVSTALAVRAELHKDSNSFVFGRSLGGQ